MAKVKVGGARVKRGQDSIGTHLVIGVSFLSFSSLFFFLPSLLVGYFLFFSSISFSTSNILALASG
jgi:hypothetical protein